VGNINVIRCVWLPVLAILLCPSMGFADGTNEFGCDEPELPSLPNKLNSEETAESVRASLADFFDAGAAFRKCIAQFADDNKAAVDEATRERLRELYSDSEATEREIAKRWNQIFSQHLSAKRLADQ